MNDGKYEQMLCLLARYIISYAYSWNHALQNKTVSGIYKKEKER